MTGNFLKSILLSAGGLTVGVGGTGYLYLYSRQQVGDQLKGPLLQNEGVAIAWETLIERLNQTEHKDLNHEKLKEVKNISDKEAQTQALKNWCHETTGETFSSIFEKTNNDLFRTIRRWCRYSIGEKVGENRKFKDLKHNDLKIRVDELKNSSDDKLILTLKMREVIDEKDQDKQEEKLLEACKQLYGSMFIGYSNFYQLAEKYCTIKGNS